MKKIPMWVWLVGAAAAWFAISKFKSGSASAISPGPAPTGAPVSEAERSARVLYAQLSSYGPLNDTDVYKKYMPVIAKAMGKGDWKTANTYLAWLAGYMG